MWSKYIVGLSGRIGSGKSSLASVLSEQSRWPRAAFGDYLRQLAEQRGLETDRQTLQDLGEQQISNGWDRFCLDVLDHAGWRSGEGLVVDGIRHIEAVRTLKRLIHPQELFLIYLAVDELVRHDRVALREGRFSNIRDFERHSTESQVIETLPMAANLVVDGTRSVADLAEDVWTAMGSRKVRRDEEPGSLSSGERKQDHTMVPNPEWN